MFSTSVSVCRAIQVLGQMTINFFNALSNHRFIIIKKIQKTKLINILFCVILSLLLLLLIYSFNKIKLYNAMSSAAAAAGAKIPIVTKISSNIIRILGCNPSLMTLQGTNTYLLGNGKSRILLDTGDQDKPNYIEHLKAVLKQENVNINTILLTHWHHDHIGGVKDVLKLIAEINNNNKVDECKVWKFPRKDAPDIYTEIPDTIKLNPLSNGQEFSVDGATVKIMYTPGHTTDHVVLTLKEDNSLFSGDCILGEGTAVFEDLYEYMKSLQLILDIKPTIIYPAHGNIINDPIPKIKYYIEHRNQRESQIFNVLMEHPNEWFTELDIVKIVYKEISEDLWPAAAYNVNHHLTKLTKENRIIESVIEPGQIHKWQLKCTKTSML